MSRCHGSKFLDLDKPWFNKYGRKKGKIYIYDFPVHDCAEEQNVNP